MYYTYYEIVPKTIYAFIRFTANSALVTCTNDIAVEAAQESCYDSAWIHG